jgi:hypothetical protein
MRAAAASGKCDPSVVCAAGGHATAMEASAHPTVTHVDASLLSGTAPWKPIIFKLPSAVKRVIINVGSNKDPPRPDVGGAEDLAVIAVEPVLKTAAAIPPHPRLYVITAAVSDATGFANFFTYNDNGVSSSLSEVPDSAKEKGGGYNRVWANDSRRGIGYPPVAFVPVLTMRQLLDAVPDDVAISMLKTDMQGFDFAAVSPAGAALRRIDQIYAEVNCNGFANYPTAPCVGAGEGFASAASASQPRRQRAARGCTHTHTPRRKRRSNDYNRDWTPFMKTIGFALNMTECGRIPQEANALWTRDA